jgi:hypothetical protein
MKYLYDAGENISLDTEDMAEVIASVKYPARVKVKRIPPGTPVVITTYLHKKPIIRHADTRKKAFLQRILHLLLFRLVGNFDVLSALVFREKSIEPGDFLHVYNCIKEEMNVLKYLHEQHFSIYEKLSWECTLTDTRLCYHRLASGERDILPYYLLDDYCDKNDLDFPKEKLFERKVRCPSELRNLLTDVMWLDNRHHIPLKAVRVEVI